MKQKLVAMVLAFAVVCTSQSFGSMPNVMAAATEAAAGTTYYFSSNGDNNNSGTTESEAWQTLDKLKGIQLQPGDSVLLQKGSVFDGFIHLKDVAGTEEAPIRIGSYGQGARPIINTKGQGIWYQNYGGNLDSNSHKYKGYVSSSILLYDAEYVEISDLEITNEAPAIETVYNKADVMNRTGVAGVAQNKGTLDHIYLNNLYIHDVIGNVYDKHMDNGGIYFTQSKPADEAATGIAKYDDLRIENCYVDNVNRWGIAVGYTYRWGKFNTGAIADEIVSEYGSTDVVIRNNYIKDAGGDAITTMYCDRPLVEYNVSDGAARHINNTDYSDPEGAPGKVAAAIWPWKCKTAIFQYNEVFDTCVNQDSQAWDADWGDGTIYQYNYSHNNGGGCVMFCGSQAINNIFRFNISQDDLGGVMNPAGQPDAHVYNNTFYIKEGIDFIRTNMGGGPMVVENNIIYYHGATEKTENWFKHTDAEHTLYDNNLYFGYANLPSNEKNYINADPKLTNPGTAPTGVLDILDTPGADLGNSSIVHARTVFDGYKLAADSPAINAGKYIPNNGGQDFFGNELNDFSLDIGAHQTNTESAEVSMELYSDIYTIEEETISKVVTGTKAGELLSNLIFDSRVTVSVVDGTGKAVAEDAKLTEAMKVRMTNGGDTKEYSIKLEKVFVEYSPVGMTAEDGSHQSGNESEGPGNYALDNDLTTMWHTDWNGCAREATWITIDMKEAKNIEMLKYVPRSSGSNGIITEYEIYVSDDGQSWGQAIASGTWDGSNNTQYAEFPKVQKRYVKLVATNTKSQVAGKIFASAVEIRLGYAQE